MKPATLIRAAGVTSARPLRGRYWRAIAAGSDPLSIAGSLARGGRYNPPGEFAALYCSEAVDLALAEATGVADELRAAAVDVTLARVLDLTDPLRRASYLLRESDLTADEHELTRHVGRAARAVGFEALLVPSTRGGRNLVVFPDRLSAGSRLVRVTDDEVARAS